MDDREKIYDLLINFLTAGLINKDVAKLAECFADSILGIGLGEQGFVTCLEDVRQVVESGIKAEDTAAYNIEIERVESKIFNEAFAMICAEVTVHSYQPENGKRGKSQFQQSLVLLKKAADWKICGLHASTPTFTEEGIQSYPLKIAERTLNSLREKIGEEAYLKEEQYRKAVLADTIAFYIVNFTKDIFEKCQLQNDSCIYVDAGTPYNACVMEKTVEYVHPEDRDHFLNCLNGANIEKAFDKSDNEVVCQYRMRLKNGGYIWTKTIIRLIADVVTGERKGIMYVKNIDEEKRQAENIQQKADRDSMTKLLNKGTFIRETENLLSTGKGSGVFLMMDVDNFKQINDTYGHPVGDRVLIAIADGLTEHFGKDGLVARVGGDEFAVFFHTMKKDDALEKRIQEFLNYVRNLTVPGYASLKTTVSMGGVYWESCCFDDFYEKADNALYKAKAAGKDMAKLL